MSIYKRYIYIYIWIYIYIRRGPVHRKKRNVTIVTLKSFSFSVYKTLNLIFPYIYIYIYIKKRIHRNFFLVSSLTLINEALWMYQRSHWYNVNSNAHKNLRKSLFRVSKNAECCTNFTFKKEYDEETSTINDLSYNKSVISQSKRTNRV